jgi:hypothetical protein
MRRPWLRLLPRLLAALLIIWGGLQIARSNLAIGLAVVVVGAISIVLLWRIWVVERTATMAKDGDLTEPEIDYVVWAALGLLMIFAILLVILAITGR